MRKVIENTNLRSVNTMTAEEIEKLAAEQQREMEEEEEMQDKTKTQCVCGHECQEMDLSYCDICGEVVCDMCANTSSESYLCSECFEENCDREEPVAENEEQQEEPMQAEQQIVKATEEEKLEQKRREFMEKIEIAMKKAHSEEQESVDLGVVKIRTQSKRGKSLWAQWVYFGYLKPCNIYWAFRELEDGKRQWLAFYVDSGQGKGKFVDLTTQEGKDALTALEEKYRQYLISTGKRWCTKPHLESLGYWETWTLDQIYEDYEKKGELR